MGQSIRRKRIRKIRKGLPQKEAVNGESEDDPNTLEWRKETENVAFEWPGLYMPLGWNKGKKGGLALFCFVFFFFFFFGIRGEENIRKNSNS